MRSPRQTAPANAVQPLADDRRHRPNPYRGNAARTSYVVATAHSPPPVHHMSGYGVRGSSGRASSPDQEALLVQPCVSPQGSGRRTDAQNYQGQEAQRRVLATPRSSSRARSNGSQNTVPAPLPMNMYQAAEMSQGQRGRAAPAWTFGSQENHQANDVHKRMGSDATSEFGQSRARAVSPVPAQAASAMQRVASPAPTLAPVPAFAGVQPRRVLSPPRAVYVTRSPSPVDLQRSHSPSGAIRGTSGAGFSWTPAAAVSPRAGPMQGTAAMRTLSPTNIVGGGPGVYAWSPDPPSPHGSPRAFSPPPPNAISFARTPSMGVQFQAAPLPAKMR